MNVQIKKFLMYCHIIALHETLRKGISKEVSVGGRSSPNNGALEQDIMEQIIGIRIEEPHITQGNLAERLGIGRKVLQIKVNSLKEVGRIERVGGKRYGNWKVVK